MENGDLTNPDPEFSATENIPNYLWQAIAVTVLCCLPLGIPAIVYAAKINALVASGQIDAAKEASAKAKMWCWISFGLGIVTTLASIIMNVLVAFGAAAAEY
jgi:hypothetical protein